jgi:hypothetical protein
VTVADEADDDGEVEAGDPTAEQILAWGEARERYRDRFGPTLSTIAVPFSCTVEATKLLEIALDTDEGYDGNEEFFERLGFDPPDPTVPY